MTELNQICDCTYDQNLSCYTTLKCIGVTQISKGVTSSVLFSLQNRVKGYAENSMTAKQPSQSEDRKGVEEWMRRGSVWKYEGKGTEGKNGGDKVALTLAPLFDIS